MRRWGRANKVISRLAGGITAQCPSAPCQRTQPWPGWFRLCTFTPGWSRAVENGGPVPRPGLAWSRTVHRWCNGKETACQCRRHKRCWFDPWVGRIPWSRKWWPAIVYAWKIPQTGEPGRLQPTGSQRSDMIEGLSVCTHVRAHAHTHTHTHTHTTVCRRGPILEQLQVLTDPLETDSNAWYHQPNFRQK